MNDRTTILKSEFFRNLANYMAAENSNLNEMRSITNQNSAYRRKPNSPERFRPQIQTGAPRRQVLVFGLRKFLHKFFFFATWSMTECPYFVRHLVLL